MWASGTMTLPSRNLLLLFLHSFSGSNFFILFMHSFYYITCVFYGFFQDILGLNRIYTNKMHIFNYNLCIIHYMQYPKNEYSKDSDSLHLYVKDIRILTPKEYEALREAISKESHRITFDILLITGLRYAELLRLYDNPGWYNEKKNLIHLPTEAQKKAKRRQLERTIYPLPPMFSYLVKIFLESRRPPAETTWNKDLQRWAIKAGLNPFGMSVKTTRKTIESWCIASGLMESAVCLRQGHDSLTSMRHYQGLAFTEEERWNIKRKLTDWGLIR